MNNKSIFKKIISKYFRNKGVDVAPVSKMLNQGFTMIEMMVVMAIFGIITAVVMFQYGKFNSQIIMTNMAYEVAMSIRQAQVYALGVRSGQETAGGDSFLNQYGSYLNLEKSDTDFIFFIDYGTEIDPANNLCDDADGNPDCFACVTGDECLEKLSLTRDIFFDTICLSDTGDIFDSDDNCTAGSTQKATMTFARPNPDATITDIADDSSYTSAAIVLKNSFGNRRAVVIRNTGLISVEVLSDE